MMRVKNESGRAPGVGIASQKGSRLLTASLRGRLLHVTHVTWGYPNVRATHEAAFFANHAEGLVKTAHLQLDVVSPLTWVPRPIAWLSRRWRDRLVIPRQYSHNQVQVYRPRFVRLPTPAQWCSDLVLLEAVYRRCLAGIGPDIVHVHGANAMGLAALKAAASLQIRTVLTMHGGDVYNAPFLGPRYREVFDTAVGMADRCIGVSSDLAETTGRLTGAQVTHLPIGINLQRFSSDISKAAARERLELPSDARLLLFVGNLLTTKGVEVLLDAIARCSSAPLAVFAGEGPLASEVQREPRARWLGPVANEKIPLLMRAADVLVLPSFLEGLGTVLIEAGACATPAIGAAVGGIPSVLGDGRGYLVPPRDSVALARVIDDVFADYAEAEHRACALRHHVHEQYDATVNGAKLVKVYMELAGCSG